MVEKEVTLKILADVDDSQVEDLENVLQQIVNGKITVPVEADTSELEQVESDIEDVKSRLSELQAKVEVDSSEIESLESELTDLEAQKLELDVETDTSELELLDSQIADIENSLSSLHASVEVDSSEIESLESELADLEATQLELTVDADSSGVDDVKSSVEDLESEIDNVNNTPISPQGDTSGLDNVSESVSGLNEALTAVGAGVSLAGIEQMVDTAGNIEDSWNRLALTFGSVTDQMKTDISEAGAVTGRSGGLIRSYFNDMGIAGIHNSELLQQSFEALSGRAYQTGNSIESMEQKMKMMVMSGNAGARQLTQLGLTTEDLGRVMGVSGEEASKMFKNLSQEDRLRVLTQAMGEGRQANEMYKNSWQGLKAQIDKATAGLMGAIGSAILPVLVPAMKAAADVVNFLADGFKKLPEPIRAVIGIVGALVMGFLAYQTVIAGMKALNIVSIFTDLIGALRGVTMAQLASNAAALANPYVLIAMAVIALIAALWYLYNTNEAVRQAFDHVGEALSRLWETLSTALQPAIDAITQAWNGFMEALGLTNGDILDGIIFFIVAFAEGLVAIIDGITQFVGWAQQLWASFDQLVNGIDWMGWLQVLALVLTGPIGWIILLIQHWDQIAPAVGNALERARQVVVTKLEEIKQWFYSKIQLIVDTVKDGANRIYHFFIDPITRIKEKVGEELAAVKATVMSYIQPLIDAFNALGSAASWAFSFLGLGQRSPGNIYKSMKRELEWTTSFVEDDKPGLVSATANLGRDLVSSFNPRIGEGLSFDVNGFEANKQGTQSTGANGNGRQIVNNLTFNLYGDMDTEERMKKFLDYVTEYLDWDNNTAGRNMEVL